MTGDRYDDRPYKNRYSHVHDALQYLMMGAGEGKSLIAGKSNKKPYVAKKGWEVFKPKKIKSTWDFLRRNG